MFLGITWLISGRYMMFSLRYSRRDVLRSSVGIAGLTVPTFLQLKAQAATSRKAKSCIVIYCWGGISHFESWDPKPEALVDLRGEFKPISTATPGIQFCEHLPLMAQHSEKMAIVRSVHHTQGGHQQGMYTSLTGHIGRPVAARRKVAITGHRSRP